MLIDGFATGGGRILTLSPFQAVYLKHAVVDPESDVGSRLRGVVISGTDATAMLKDAGIGWVIARADDPFTARLLAQAPEWGWQFRPMEEGYVVLEVE